MTTERNQGKLLWTAVFSALERKRNAELIYSNAPTARNRRYVDEAGELLEAAKNRITVEMPHGRIRRPYSYY